MINKKIAVLISGHLRTFDKTYENNKKYLFDHIKEYDTYIHTWNFKDNLYQGNLSIEQINNIENKIFELYSPRKILIENYDEKLPELLNISDMINYHIGPGTQPIRTVSMWYSRYKCHSLINDNYDIIILTRPDNIFSKNITNEDINEELINIPNSAMENNGKMLNDDDRYFIGSVGDFYGYMDPFITSNQKNMSIICDLYNNMLNYWKEGCMFHPETLLKYHIDKNHLIVNRINFKVELLRYNRDINNNYIHQNQQKINY